MPLCTWDGGRGRARGRRSCPPPQSRRFYQKRSNLHSGVVRLPKRMDLRHRITCTISAERVLYSLACGTKWVDAGCILQLLKRDFVLLFAVLMHTQSTLFSKLIGSNCVAVFANGGKMDCCAFF